MISYLLVFGVSAGATFLATPLVRKLSLRAGFIDRPSDRKVHPEATPTAGGLAMFGGVLVALGVARLMPQFSELFGRSSDLGAALLASSVLVLVGVVDDIRGVSALGKLSGQVLAAGLLILAGVQLLWLYIPGQGILSLDPSLGVPLTVVWVVAIVNAVNLIDGLDGLAAGMMAIAAAAFFVYMYNAPGGATSSAALLSTVVAGVCIGFLPWNFHPARIFMGDSGSELLGGLLAVATIVGVGRNPYPPSGGDVAVLAIPVLIPLLVLAIPFLDVVLAIVRRMRRGLGIAHADKEHIHHRLLDIGHTHRQAVLLMYLWSALISGTVLAVAFINGRLVIGAIALVALGIFLATALPRLVVRTGREHPGNGAGRPEELSQSGPAAAGGRRRASP